MSTNTTRRTPKAPALANDEILQVAAFRSNSDNGRHVVLELALHQARRQEALRQNAGGAV